MPVDRRERSAARRPACRHRDGQRRGAGEGQDAAGPKGDAPYAGGLRPRAGLFPVGSLAGIHVLLVDDDPASRDELAAILRYCGSLLTVAASEVEGLRVLDFVRPHVIVLAVPHRHRGEVSFARRSAIPIVAIMWPDDPVSVAGATVVQLHRPLDAWEVCRALATAVTAD
jgi:CheY-like chemotaxis protein